MIDIDCNKQNKRKITNQTIYPLTSLKQKYHHIQTKTQSIKSSNNIMNNRQTKPQQIQNIQPKTQTIVIA